MGQVNSQNVEQVFTYQSPTEQQIPKYAAVRDAFIDCAKVVLECVPECADRAVALRKLREARMDANAAIALCGLI
jgi:hypothetical protein